MRLIVDSLIALMLVGILAVVVLHYRQEHHQLEQIRTVHQALTQIQEQVVYHRALAQVQEARVQHARTINETSGFPQLISPAWFNDRVPLNVFASARQPWVDLAPDADRHDHPPDPIIHSDEQGGFWYNPQRGIIRARVPAQFSEQRTLDLYNRVNGTALLSLPTDDDAERQPQPHALTPAPEHRPAPEPTRASQINEQIDTLHRALPTLFSLTPPDHTSDELPPADDAETSTASETPKAAQSQATTEQVDANEREERIAPPRPNRPTLADRPNARRE